jgi:hypothetical protein
VEERLARLLSLPLATTMHLSQVKPATLLPPAIFLLPIHPTPASLAIALSLPLNLPLNLPISNNNSSTLSSINGTLPSPHLSRQTQQLNSILLALANVTPNPLESLAHGLSSTPKSTNIRNNSNNVDIRLLPAPAPSLLLRHLLSSSSSMRWTQTIGPNELGTKPLTDLQKRSLALSLQLPSRDGKSERGRSERGKLKREQQSSRRRRQRRSKDRRGRGTPLRRLRLPQLPPSHQLRQGEVHRR